MSAALGAAVQYVVIVWVAFWCWLWAASALEALEGWWRNRRTRGAR